MNTKDRVRQALKALDESREEFERLRKLSATDETYAVIAYAEKARGDEIEERIQRESIGWLRELVTESD